MPSSFLERLRSYNPLKKFTRTVHPHNPSHGAPPHPDSHLGTEMTVFRKSGGKKRSRRVKSKKSKKSRRSKSKKSKSRKSKSKKSKSRSRRH